MSLAVKILEKESFSTIAIARYRVAIVLFCVGLALAIACMVFTPTAIGKIGGDQTFPIGL
jgi:uncharacterized membrane protein